MCRLVKRFGSAAFFLLLLPAGALADGIIIGPCISGAPVGNLDSVQVANCVLVGGGNASYTGRAISGVNFFQNIHSPVTVTSFVDQSNTFIMTIQSFPMWTVPGPVPTNLSLDGTVTILQEGATVDILLTGRLGGPFLEIRQHFANNATFSVAISGLQAINNVATSTLTVTINGAATFNSPNSGVFAGGVPEPTTLVLLGTGLTGVMMKLRKRGKRRAG